MKTSTYDRIMNGCVIVAALSAIFFDKAENYSWLLGLGGMLAGATAVGVYFYNQWYPSQKSIDKNQDNGSVAEVIPSEGYHRDYSKNIVSERFVTFGLLSDQKPELREYILGLTRVSSSSVKTIGYSSLYTFCNSLWSEFERKSVERRHSTDEIIEIINTLSKQPYEFVLEQNGDFVIRPTRVSSQGTISNLEENRDWRFREGASQLH